MTHLLLSAALLAPLDPFPGLTSGFGEYRAGGRFHAGLDYTTGERTGRPVRAVADGWVERVRSSGVGYGLSLYQRLPDGRTAVYAHLDRFAPALAAYVAARQDSSGQYEQDLWPKAGQIRFRRGDIVAWTGQTGVGPPHLHFEIRRGDMNLNPMRFGLTVPDRTPPSIAAVVVTPAEPGGRVAGSYAPWRGTFGRADTLAGPVVRGPFRLALDTYDRVGTRSNRLATWRLVARLDGAVAFEAVLDSVAWEDMAISDRVFDLEATLAGDTDRRRLEAIPGDRSGVVRRGPPVWNPEPGRHTFVFEARDEAGNVTRRALALRVVPANAASDATTPSRADGFLGDGNAPRVTPRGTGAIIGVRDGAARPPFARWSELDLVDSLAVSGGTLYAARAVPTAGRGPGGSGFVRGGGGPGRVELADGVALSWDEPAFHEPAALVARTLPAPAPGGELASAGTHAVAIEPGALALARGVTLSWRVDPGARTRGVGLFRRDGRSWSFLSGADSTGALVATTRRLGTFALLADSVAPRIVPPARYDARAGVVPPALAFGLTDHGAGLSAAQQRVYLDGQRVPAEYDPDADRLTWRPRSPLAPGPHAVVVEAVDGLGNRARLTYVVESR